MQFGAAESSKPTITSRLRHLISPGLAAVPGVVQRIPYIVDSLHAVKIRAVTFFSGRAVEAGQVKACRDGSGVLQSLVNTMLIP